MSSMSIEIVIFILWEVVKTLKIQKYFFWLYQALPGLTGLDGSEAGCSRRDECRVSSVGLIELIKIIR